MNQDKMNQVNSMEDLNELPILKKKMIKELPIFRAETEKQNFSEDEFNSDKSLIKVDNTFYIIGLIVTKCGQIESETEDIVYSTRKGTISIHMEDMTDSEGNKIFASLSSDGKGGDIGHDKEHNCEMICRYYSGAIELRNVQGKWNKFLRYSDLKVTGIQNDT